MPSLAIALPLLALLFATSASAASAVLGIDLGTNFIKAVIVKPGTPLDIVLTKDSKRKEAGAVAFKPASKPVDLGHFPERLYGGDALALSGRFPGEVFTHLKPLVGTSVRGDYSNYRNDHPAIAINFAASGANDGIGGLKLSSSAFSDKEQPWTVEELLAMQLRNIRTNAEAMTGKGSKVTDAVITIPSYFDASQRRAVMRAASLAGIDVMALVTDGLAVGIDYAVKRDPPNTSRSKDAKPELHMVLDVGAASTVATILGLQRRDVKDVGRFNKTVTEVAVLGNGWDRTLGGNAMNGLIVDHILKAFMKKPEVEAQNIAESDVRNHPRAAVKIAKEAERARQVLSANTEVRSSFEGLYNDIDLTVKLTRTEFEDMAKSFTGRLEDVIKEALESGSASLKELDSIILFGGAVRMPLIQRQLEKLVGKDCEIRSNVNADESAAFGAAFKAAGLSPSFRVKEIRDFDTAVYESGIIQTIDGKEKKQQIWKQTSRGGPKPKQVSLKQKDDFGFAVYQTTDNVDRTLFTVKTTNLTKSVASLETLGCTRENIATSFGLRLSPVSGMPEVSSGTVSCEIVPAAKSGGLGDSVKGIFGFGGSKDQEPLKDDKSEPSIASESASKSSSSSSAAASASGKATVPKKRTEIINIAFTTTQHDDVAPSKEDHARIKERLAAFERADRARLQREEALNVLEAFTYKARDLLEDVGFRESSTEDVRSQLSSLLGTTSEWLYGEGVQAPTDVFKSKLADLKKLVTPVQKRIEEGKKRPDVMKALETSLDQTKSLIKGMQDQIVLAASAASSAAAEAAAKATASSETSTASDMDDLEEPDPSFSTDVPPKESEVIKSPYSEEDVSEIQKLFDTMSEWVKDKTDAQSKLLPNVDPIVTVKEIEAQAEKLSSATMRLLRKKMQVPKKAKPSAKSKASKSASSSGSSASIEASGAADKEVKPGVIDLDDLEGFDGSSAKTPTEEEIMSMVKRLQAKESRIKYGGASDVPVHGEL